MWPQKKSDPACELFAVRLEDAAILAAARGEDLALQPDLSAHVADCERCRLGVEAMPQASALLRAGLEPIAGPGPYFARRVIAAIRSEEERRATQRNIFWRPLEHLAARVAVAAGLVVMLLSFYIYAFVVPMGGSPSVAQSESYELVPHQQVDPQPETKDDVLMSLVEHNNVR
jgi:anti-sigma factor RsiW